MWKILLLAAVIGGAAYWAIKNIDVKPDAGPSLGFSGYSKGLIQAENKAKNVMHADNLATARNAVEKYYGEKGSYPASLQVLVDGFYLDRIPNSIQYDPATGQITETP
jgi:uncharacterized protein (UPF0333 family)